MADDPRLAVTAAPELLIAQNQELVATVKLPANVRYLPAIAPCACTFPWVATFPKAVSPPPV